MEPREKAYDAGVFDVAVLNEDGAGELARLGVRFGGDEGEGERGNGLLFLRVRTKRRKKRNTIQSRNCASDTVRGTFFKTRVVWKERRMESEIRW